MTRTGAIALAAALAALLAACQRGVDDAPAPRTANTSGQSKTSQGQSNPGGLGGGTAAMGAGPASADKSSVPGGSANRTTGSSVGNRP
jgi:hypothetical protein